jgi:SAM-dependent methyltransferase
MTDVEAIRAFEHAGWEKAADTYEASFATATRQFIPALLNAASVSAGQAVLDIACGPGFVTAAAAALGATARGLDFSPAMLAVARRLHASIGFDEGDAEALPYPDDRFDAVVSNFGVHHVARPILALQQAKRVLRPCGSLAFTIWGPPAENIAWKLVFDAIRRRGNPSASPAPAPGGGFAGPADCSAALAQAGFDAIRTHTVSAVWCHSNGRMLLEALRSGTARMAALIESQPADAIPAIIADIDQEAAVYAGEQGLRVPLVAVIASGRKPGR